MVDEDQDMELRVAFDFDGVIADDQAEKIFSDSGQLQMFHDHEQKNISIPHNPGPLADFLKSYHSSNN